MTKKNLIVKCVSAVAVIYTAFVVASCSSDTSNPSDAGGNGGAQSVWTLGGSVTGIARGLWADGGTLYLATSSGVFRSTDTARTWTQLVTRSQLGIAGGFEAGVVARGSIIYVGSSDFAFFSSNSGTTGDKFARAWDKAIMSAKAYTFQAITCSMEAMSALDFEPILAIQLGRGCLKRAGCTMSKPFLIITIQSMRDTMSECNAPSTMAQLGALLQQQG